MKASRRILRPVLLRTGIACHPQLPYHPPELAQVPAWMRLYADRVEWLLSFLGQQNRGDGLQRNAHRALLVDYVFAATGQWHDAEMASLLGAVLETPDAKIDAKAQESWRRRHPSSEHQK